MKYTIKDFKKDFPNDKACMEYIIAQENNYSKGYHKGAGQYVNLTTLRRAFYDKRNQMKKPELKLIAVKLTPEQLQIVQKYAKQHCEGNISQMIRRMIIEFDQFNRTLKARRSK